MTLTAERARELLDYDPVTGVLRKRNRQTGVWRELNTLNKDGYFNVTIDKKTYIAHRVIFLMMTGRWPDPTVDHVNRVKTDNRWSNLRESSVADNTRNRGSYRRHQFANVYQTPSTGRFEARARINGKLIRFGTHDTPEAAVAAIQSRKVRMTS